MRFLRVLDERRVAAAQDALKRMLDVTDFRSRRFLDVGSGSGLTSLVARRLGAMVLSFDYDPNSVACTNEVRRRFAGDDPDWTVRQGSALDPKFMASLGTFDVVCSWGVLHHTGAMWRALDLSAQRVAPGGDLYIAIYNDQGFWSRYWYAIKRLYNHDFFSRALVIAVHIPSVYLARVLRRAVRPRRENDRGMSLWVDLLDWLGGYPFEVAKPEAVFDFLKTRGFTLKKLKTCAGGYGCNEFVFRRDGAPAAG
ncbi:MAG TPA: class I SAM-dependent methyltransferase [Vicinamibacterales bacterium]|nr:class I SAM-dependent methyltransferase [Vicinamibacterales bacterium]